MFHAGYIVLEAGDGFKDVADEEVASWLAHEQQEFPVASGILRSLADCNGFIKVATVTISARPKSYPQGLWITRVKPVDKPVDNF